MSTRSQILDAIKKECEKQHREGLQIRLPFESLANITEELGKAAATALEARNRGTVYDHKGAVDNTAYDHYVHELAQTAVCCVQAIESAIEHQRAWLS